MIDPKVYKHERLPDLDERSMSEESRLVCKDCGLVLATGPEMWQYWQTVSPKCNLVGCDHRSVESITVGLVATTTKEIAGEVDVPICQRHLSKLNASAPVRVSIRATPRDRATLIGVRVGR